MSLEYDLRQEQVIHLDLTEFTEVQIGTSVKSTIEKMRQEGHNCAFITDSGKLVGVFTDRDVLRRVVAAPETWNHPIEDVMTPRPLTVKSTDPADAALNLMNEKHFRNVPVIDETGAIVGNLTHYAIIKYLADHFQESVYNLPPEPDRITRKRDGA
jgi:CBS domain-containing protein